MIIDCHVHVSACTPGHGSMSHRLLNSGSMRFVKWRFGLAGADAATERGYEKKLIDTIIDTPEIDAAVGLAFDAVYTRQGELDSKNTHLYVTNEYVIELARKYPGKLLFGASVNPWRPDAIAELERCAAAGAVLVKWLPLTQGFDPSDPRCFPFYEALAHFQIPLLSHTGWENALPTVLPTVADPLLLEPALERGVKVIAAHCGTRSMPWNSCFLDSFVRLARQYEHFYGDTSALNLPTRCYAYERVLNDPRVREKLVHGSDWPIIPVPPARHLGMPDAMDLMFDENWMRRDARIKQKLGFEKQYWHRAAQILRIPRHAIDAHQKRHRRSEQP